MGHAAPFHCTTGSLERLFFLVFVVVVPPLSAGFEGFFSATEKGVLVTYWCSSALGVKLYIKFVICNKFVIYKTVAAGMKSMDQKSLKVFFYVKKFYSSPTNQ